MSSRGSVLEFTLHSTGSGVKQHLDIAGNPNDFVAEGHRAFGGTDSAPSPLDYALGALASCTQVTGAIVAAENDALTLGAWTVDLVGHLHNGVLVFGEDGESNFSDVTLQVAVETNLADDAFTRFTEQVERRCPISQLFRASGVELHTEWKNIPLP